MSGEAALQLRWGSGALLERTCLARWLAGAGAECRFSATQLLSAVSLVLAGRDQGRVPRPCEYRRALRPRGAQPVVRNSASERGIAEVVCEADDASRVYTIQCVPARPVR